MDVHTEGAKRPICAKLTLPGSKSLTNRALLLAALADGVSEISGVLASDDTEAMVNALRALGLMVQFDQATNTCIIGGSSGQFPRKEASIGCHDAATVARFLMAAVAATPGSYHFDASPALRARPLAPLLRTLTLLGVQVIPADATAMPLTITGTEQLKGGEIDIDATVTSQFASALLMVAPFAQSSVTLNLGDAVSHTYIDMTSAVMAQFGVQVRRLHHGKYQVLVPQRYKACDFTIEPDLSTAANFFAAAAATGGSVAIPTFGREQTTQGDVEFLAVLEKMGCTVEESATTLTVQGPERLRGVNADMRHYSDTFLALAALAPFANSPTTITNIGHTRYKESNRLKAIAEALTTLNIKITVGPDWLRIYPSTPQANRVESHHDHRMVMALAILGLKTPGIVIQDAECVSKTCPHFFSLWKTMLASG